VLFAGVLVVASACSNQGEGERCDVLNGDDDCKTDDGLICYRAADLNNSNSDRCCPRDRARATNPVCKTPLSTVTNDAQAPTDSGPTPVIPDSSTNDANDGAPQDSGITDAPADG
jgi:hypothetical protein